MDASSKKKALEMLSELMAGAASTPDARTVADRLLAREKLGSTALGHGVAIPHGRCPDLSNAVAAFLKLKNGVDFDAPDGQPVDLLVGLLAQLAELFSKPDVRDQLRGPISPSGLLDILSQSTGRV